MRRAGAFRSVEEWKAALMALPENNFFELLRSVFGNIKTPFNKQKLLDELFYLLSRNEIRKIIAAYIGERDCKVIAAIALLDEPEPGELERFFAGEMPPPELNALLANLEERLIMYRFQDEAKPRLALNPALARALAPFIADSRKLFPFFVSAADGGAEPELPGRRASDSRTLAALFAFILGEEEPFKPEGSAGTGTKFREFPEFRELRKKFRDEGKKIFPGLDLELAIKTLLKLELLRREGRGFAPRRERIEDFCERSAREREEYWAAGVYLCLTEDEPDRAENGGNDCAPGDGGFRSARSRLRGTASSVHDFMNFLGPGEEGGLPSRANEGGGRRIEKFYPEITLRRVFELLGKGGGGKVWGFALFENRERLAFGPFLAALETAGLLARAGNRWKSGERPARGERENPEGGGSAAGPFIAMDSPFSFILYPEIPFADALALSAFCSAKDTAPGKYGGTPAAFPDAVSFELTRQSAVRGFDQGISSAAMIDLLSRLSGNRLDASLGWTLREWENRYAGVSLHEGIVLCLAEDRRYLVEAESVASLIRQTLAPGVYLVSAGDRAEAAKVLRKAGVDIVAQPPSGAGAAGGGGESGAGRGSAGLRNSFPRLDSAERHFAGFSPAPEEDGGEKPLFPEGEADSADSIKRNFRRILEKKTLSPAEREELAARIERKLVLTEAQLEGSSVRYEKLEARGLDYSGKAVIAKQAIETGSMLEISWPGPGGAANRVAGFPLALEKKEGGSVLVLRPVPGTEAAGGEGAGAEDGGSGGEIRIPLGKIGLLRRIKQSIFGG